MLLAMSAGMPPNAGRAAAADPNGPIVEGSPTAEVMPEPSIDFEASTAGAGAGMCEHELRC